MKLSRLLQGQTSGVFSLLTATLLYGLFGVLSRTVGLAIPIFYQNLTRNAFSSVLAGIIFIVWGSWTHVAARDWIWIVLRNISGMIAFLCFFFAILALPFGTSYFLFYGSSTVMGYLLGYFLFREHITPIKGVALAIGMIGLALVYRVNVEAIPFLPLALSVISGAATASWNILSKKVSATYSALQLSFLDQIISVPLYAGLSIAARESWTLPALTTPWIASLGLGAFYVMTGILVVTGFRYLQAQIGTIIMLAEILFAILFGYLFYGETVTVLTSLGGALIIIAIILPELPWKKIYSR